MSDELRLERLATDRELFRNFAMRMVATLDDRDFLRAQVDHLCAELASLRERLRWIPVAEQLPESAVQVLVYNTHVFVGMYLADVRRWETFEGEELILNVTHWRNIDKPLKLLTITADPSTTPPEPSDA